MFQRNLTVNKEVLCKILNDYFLSILTKEDRHIIPVSEQISRVVENEKLKDVEITRELVVKEIDRILILILN